MMRTAPLLVLIVGLSVVGMVSAVAVLVATSTPNKRGLVGVPTTVAVAVPKVAAAIVTRMPAVCVFLAAAVCVLAGAVLLGLSVLVDVRVRVFVCVFVGDSVLLALTKPSGDGVNTICCGVDMMSMRPTVSEALAVAERVLVTVNDTVSVQVAVAVLVTVALAVAEGVVVGVLDADGAALVEVPVSPIAVPLPHGVGVSVATAVSVTVMSIAPGIVSVGVPVAGQGSIGTAVAVGIFFFAAISGTRMSRNGPYVGLLIAMPRTTAASTAPSANARSGTMVRLAITIR